MIDSIRIERFKRFDELQLSLRPLTILTGLNGAGKTSVIHSFLLARQAATTGVVALNGPFGLALGEAEDVLTLDADPSQGIAISATEAGKTRTWRFGVGEAGTRQLYLQLLEAPKTPSPAFSSTARRFAYLGADRFGPRDILEASSEEPSTLGVGHAGQFTAQVLATCPKEVVPTARCEPVRTKAHEIYQLNRQVEWWLCEIVKDVEIEANWLPNTNSVSLRFRPRGFSSEWMRPANNGFGLSYALPVIVAGLLTPAGATLIVENPEAHLHPAGQSRMGAFLARVAADQVQVIVETHSDHVINGIRRAVAELKLLDAAKAIIHFFGADADDHPAVTPIEVAASGALSSWPKGFFDQIETDLGMLARARRTPK